MSTPEDMARQPLRNVWIVVVAAGLLLGFALLYRHRSPVGLPGTSAVHPLAPEFSVTTIDGQRLALTGYRGKIVLLDFWATWCTPCREEIPRFVQLQDKYGADGLQIIGISMDDSAEPVRQFYRDFGMNYPVALGGAKLGELYGGVFGLPIAFLIDRQGRILSKHIGATDSAIFDKEVANALQASTSPLRKGSRPQSHESGQLASRMQCCRGAAFMQNNSSACSSSFGRFACQVT